MAIPCRLGRASAVSLAAALLLVSGCERSAQTLQVRDAWSRATPEGGTVGVVYLHLSNGGAADQLVGLRSSVSASAGLHTSSVSGGMASMTPVPVLDVPGGAEIAFAPEGLHVMLTGLRHTLVQGEHFILHLQFRSAGEREVDVVVASLGAAAPDGGAAVDHEHMHH